MLGGNLAFTLTTPFGGKRVEAGQSSTYRTRTRECNAERDNWAFGDPVLGATLGWHDGNLHYSLGTLINVPIGQWELGNPVNIGFNRWVIDTTAALTYLDQTTGLELSGAVGLTYNFENPDTDYKSGTELHAEGAAMYHASHTFSIGVNGYALRQITGDSGSGAVLGDFEGQVFAIGPALDYTFKIGEQVVATNLRYFYEFGVENRMQGHAGFLNIALPLGGHSAEEQGVNQKTSPEPRRGVHEHADNPVSWLVYTHDEISDRGLEPADRLLACRCSRRSSGRTSC